MSATPDNTRLRAAIAAAMEAPAILLGFVLAVLLALAVAPYLAWRKLDLWARWGGDEAARARAEERH